MNLDACGAAPGPLCGAPDANGSPRIVLTSSADRGITWTDSSVGVAAANGNGNGKGKGAKAPGPAAAVDLTPLRRAVDFARRDVNVPTSRIGLGLLPQERNSGPQVMPRLSFGGGRLMLVYYEARGQLGPTGYIDGIDRLMDLRAALLNPGTGQLLQSGSTTQVSQYPLKAYLQIDDLIAKGGETVDDVAAVNPPCRPDFGSDPGLPECVRQVNRVNSPHSGSGNQAFLGDYIDLVPAVSFVPDSTTGGWRWAAAAGDVPYVGYRTVFADDRHVLPPVDGNWSNYTPPGTGLPSCINPGSRNADVLTAQIDAGLVVSGPTTYKFLDIIPRAFPVQVSNRTGETAFFRIAVAPDGRPVSSFDANFLEDASADVDEVDAVILPYSSATKTLFVRQGATGSIRVDVNQISCVVPVPADPSVPPCTPQPVAGGLTGSITYNLDATNPSPDDPTNDDVHNPLISNPLISNPLISNPLISNPLISNPLISNPLISNPLISNPLISNPLISNPLISNPTIYDIQDVTWTASNTGNTSTAYIALVNLVNAARLEAANPNNPDAAGNYLFQLLIYRQAFSGAAGVGADGVCNSYNVPQDEVISVIQNPLISNPLISNPLISNPLISNPLISNATYALAPGDEVKITLRAFQLTPTASIPPEDQFNPDPNDPTSLPDIVIHSEAPNIEDGVVQPDPPTSLVITTASLPGGTFGQAYSAALAAQGGTPPYTWSLAAGSLPAGVFLNPSTGALTGTPSSVASFAATLRVVDGGSPSQSYTKSFTIAVANAPLPGTNGAAYIVGPSNVFTGDVMTPAVVVAITDGTGAVVPGVNVTLSLLPSAVASVTGNTAVTNGIGRATFSNLRITGTGVFSLLATPPGSPDGVSASFMVSTPPPVPMMFVVTNTNDSGPGSLRQALLDNNAHTGVTDTINFAIPGAAPYQIDITSALPAIASPAIVDARTQPGYNPGTKVPLVELRWAGLPPNADVSGFDVTAGGSTIAGFAINKFGTVDPLSGGRAIWLHGAAGDIVQDNYLGVDTTGGGGGGGSRPGNHSGVLIDTDGHQVDGNVISANLDGIVMRGGTGTSITGNIVGMDATGLVPAGNAFPGLSIYGSTANAYVVGNVVSGNASWGISLQGAGSGNEITGNTIGLGLDNDFVRLSPTDYIDGVTLINYGPRVRGNTTGGLLVADTPGVIVNSNVISGNTGNGLQFEGTDGGTPALVISNKVGTDPTGTLARGNVDNGIQISTSGVVIGGTLPVQLNVVSGNLSDGIAIVANDVHIVGNLIGTTADGTAALGNGQLSNPDPGCCHSGVYTDGNHTGIQIGGATAAEGNVISGNFTGLWIGTAPGIAIRHNTIGVDADGLNPVPNTDVGIGLFGTVGANVTENVIADNGGAGVLTFFSASNNALQGNAMYDNAGLGIDLGSDGVTPNDAPEGDGKQNFPVLVSVVTGTGTTQIDGTLDSSPSAGFTIDFYRSAACDPSGYGEGEIHVGSIGVSTNGSGSTAFSGAVPGNAPSGSAITATATDSGGNTSEFSACFLVP